MNKYLKLYIIFIGLIGLLASCEKDEVKTIMSDNPIPPTIVTFPDLNLQRTHGNDTLVFMGTPVDPGFQASANYYLEACASGTNFADPVQLISSVTDDAMKITVTDLNAALLKSFPADQATSLDFRIRANLVVDAGTGALGTSTNPLSYSSEIKTVSVTPYGLPRLDLLNSGTDQKIESALGNGVYTGYVYLNTSNPFTLKDPDTGTIYGDNSTALAVNGDPIPADANGWNKLDADINNLTYSINPYAVGVVGAFTSWGENPDHMMDYNVAKGYWYITIDLPAGPMKFRLNSKWDVNWGPGEDMDLPASGGTMSLPNSSGNIIISAAGNYTIHFTITGSSGSVTFIKN